METPVNRIIQLVTTINNSFLNDMGFRGMASEGLFYPFGGLIRKL
jgi:hypothetical protein